MKEIPRGTGDEDFELELKANNWVVVSYIFALMFTPTLGNESHFDEHISQRGW